MAFHSAANNSYFIIVPMHPEYQNPTALCLTSPQSQAIVCTTRLVAIIECNEVEVTCQKYSLESYNMPMFNIPQALESRKTNNYKLCINSRLLNSLGV